jgi:hypothetical protein
MVNMKYVSLGKTNLGEFLILLFVEVNFFLHFFPLRKALGL